MDEFANFCSSFKNTLSFQNETRLDLKRRELLNQLIGHFPLPLIQVDGELKSNINTDVLLADIGHHKKISLLGDLTNTLAHELSNPLFGISLCASTLECQDLDYQEVINEIKKSSSRCVSIINQLKNIYSLSPEIKSVSLADLIQDVSVIAKSETRGISIDKQILHPANLDSVNTNPTFLHQIIFNLLINAAQAIKSKNRKNGNIVLSSEATNEGFIIKIIDNGGGVEPELEPELLRPFFSTKSKGTGLGLSICSRLIDKIGGKFSIINHYPDGLEAVVNIPR
jgi:signal transduction histidine kinase